jgi:disulfide bond formation protein DsbB
MMTLLTGLLLTAVIVIALYAFGVFNTPFTDAFRVAFYLLLVLLVLSFWMGIEHQPHEGQPAAVGAAK